MCPPCRCMLFVLTALWAVVVPMRGNDAILHSFSVGDGAPAFYGSVTLGNNVLYGMTGNGGSESAGTIFSVNADGSNYAVLHNFTTDGLQSDGAYPLGSLTMAGS